MNNEDSTISHTPISESLKQFADGIFNGTLNNEMMMKYDIYYNLSYVCFILGSCLLIYKMIQLYGQVNNNASSSEINTQ